MPVCILLLECVQAEEWEIEKLMGKYGEIARIDMKQVWLDAIMSIGGEAACHIGSVRHVSHAYRNHACTCALLLVSHFERFEALIQTEPLLFVLCCLVPAVHLIIPCAQPHDPLGCSVMRPSFGP